MGWSRFCHGARVLTLDPGFVAMAPTREAARLAAMVAARAAARDRDARADAEKTVRPSTSSTRNRRTPTSNTWCSTRRSSSVARVVRLPGATRRALNYLCFANTKALFRFVRKDARWREPAEHVPVAVRASYHPNEPERLEDVYAYYVERKPGALRAWADGTGRAERRITRRKPTVRRRRREGDAQGGGRASARKTLQDAKEMVGAGSRRSRSDRGASSTRRGETGRGGCSRDGGGGRRGRERIRLPGSYATTFAGATTPSRLRRAGEGDTAVPLGMFVSERCSDGDMVVGRAVERDDGER